MTANDTILIVSELVTTIDDNGDGKYMCMLLKLWYRYVHTETV